jgi:signal transduction histidine kinase
LLVEDILHLSRIKSGIPLGEIKVINLSVETQKIINEFVEDAESKKLAMNFELPNYPVNVRIDKKGFRLILSNLISNAIKYTSEGSLSVTLLKNSEWAILKIKDTGIGIPETEIAMIFDEFYRASNARRSKILGTGIGLAGVRELVTRFGGVLKLISKENKGSEFIVHLPLYVSKK